MITACEKEGKGGSCTRKLVSVVSSVPGLPWHSVENAKLLCKAIQSRKLTPCSPFSVQGQRSLFWIMPSQLFLTYCFVELNEAQCVSWPGQPLANTYKSYTCKEQLQGEGCHAAPKAALAQSRGELAAKNDGFICTPVSGVNNNCFMQTLLFIKLLAWQWSHLAITKPCSSADAHFLFWKDIDMCFLFVATNIYHQHLSPTSAWNNSCDPFLSPAIQILSPTECSCNRRQCWLVAGLTVSQVWKCAHTQQVTITYAMGTAVQENELCVSPPQESLLVVRCSVPEVAVTRCWLS